MLVEKKLITSRFIPLKGSDTVASVKKRMQEKEIQTLPVVDNTTHALIGQVHSHDLESAESGGSIADVELHEPIKIYQDQHIFEAARLLLQYEQKVLPVVDKEWAMLGVVTREKVLEILPQLLNVTESGSVITITLDPIDFSITEMVNIIEAEKAKILGMTVKQPTPGQQVFEVSFKLDLQDVSRVAAALRRFDYTVSTSSENEILSQDIENRADELLRYIDM